MKTSDRYASRLVRSKGVAVVGTCFAPVDTTAALGAPRPVLQSRCLMLLASLLCFAISCSRGGDGTSGDLVVASAQGEQQTSTDVTEFEQFACSDDFRDYRVMLTWSTSVLESARAMLADPLRSDCWARSAFVIGVISGRIGVDADLERIVSWLERGPVDLTQFKTEPRSARLKRILSFQMAPYALAFFAGLRGQSDASGRAIEYLVGCSTTDFWQGRSALWEDFGINRTTFSESMAGTCTSVLGYTVSPIARSRLLSITSQAGTDSASQRLLPNALGALRIMSRIASEGGLDVYMLDDGGMGLNKELPR